MATLDDQIWWPVRLRWWKIEAATAPAAAAVSNQGN
jgi:hypothetical protein